MITITLNKPTNVQVLKILMDQIWHHRSCLIVADSEFLVARTYKLIDEALNLLVRPTYQTNVFEKKVFVGEDCKMFIRYRNNNGHPAVLKVINHAEYKRAPFIYNTILIIKYQ